MAGMTITSPRPTRQGAATEPDRGRHPAVAAVFAAVQASVAGLLAPIVVALAIWMATPRVSVPWTEPVRVAANIWLLGHGAPLSLRAGTVDVVPLGLLLPLLWLAWSGGVRVVAAAEARTPGRARSLLGPGAIYVASYAALAVTIGAFAGDTEVRVSLGAVLLAASLVSVTGLLVAARQLLWPGDERPALARVALVARAAGVALLGWAGVAAVVLVAGTAFGFGRIIDVQQALHPGVLGHLLLVILQLALVPTALLWSASYSTGAGFLVGQGTMVSPAGTELGPLPAVPLLGALPHAGSHPVQTVLLPLLVVAAGAFAGYWLRQRRGALPRVEQIADCAALAVIATAVGVLLAALSGGSIGPGRMAEIGPVVGLLGALLFAELFVGALLGAFAGPPIVSGRAGAVLAAAGTRLGRRGGRQLKSAAGKTGRAAGEGLEVATAHARRLGAAAAGRATQARRELRGRVTKRRP